MMVLENHGIRVEGLAFDTMLAAPAAGHSSVGLKNLALEFFGEEMTPISDLIGKGRKQITMDRVEISRAAEYAAADADFTERLRRDLETELNEKSLDKMLREYEVPLAPVLVRMQRDGVAIDVGALRNMSEELGEELDRIRNGMYMTVGHEFNLNSSKQLGDILFTELRLPPTRRTKSGYSTDAASLDGLKGRLDTGTIEGADPRAYDVLNSILEYRQLSKIKSTYVDALPGLVNPETGRIHTKYNQTGSATGRVSSNDPNVQNIPVRTELGRRVRKAFIAPDAPGSTLLAADYSQIELRILAHFSEDQALVSAFHEGKDIHNATSSLVYDVPIDEVTDDMRRIAKILNFGVLYGRDGVRHIAADRPNSRARPALHQRLLRAVPGHSRLCGQNRPDMQECWIRPDRARQAALPSQHHRSQHPRAAGGGAGGDQHADTGHRGGHHQDSDDSNHGANDRAPYALEDDSASPRRAYLRGSQGRVLCAV